MPWKQVVDPFGNIGLSAFVAALPVIFLFAITAITADIVLRDFMMPHFALENATSGQAWAAAWTRIKAEKTAFFVYVLLRIILPMAAMMGVIFVLIIPALILIAAFVFLGVLIHSAFAGAALLAGAAAGGTEVVSRSRSLMRDIPTAAC